MLIPDSDTTNATRSNDNINTNNSMMMELAVPTSTSSHINHHHHPHMGVGPKKRAETWVQDETRILISLRRDMDALFNTSKSNRHLWEQISLKMRERGFERSATMCTDKWRNLLKEYKKVKHQFQNSAGNGSNCCSNTNINSNTSAGNGKIPYFKEIEEILKERSRGSISRQHDDVSAGGSGGGCGAAHSSKVDSFLHFSDKGIDDTSIPFGPLEANGRPALNLERRLDHEGRPLTLIGADAVTSGGVSPFWQETSGNGDDTHSYDGRVITVKWGDYSRRIGIDGSADAIKDVLRSAFGLRTKRAFWLEDEDQVVRALDRDMHLGTYTLHLDEGMTIKLCHYEESDIPFPGQTISHTEEKTFYTEDNFREFMNRRGWSSLRELSGYRNIDNLDDLRPGALYRGIT